MQLVDEVTLAAEDKDAIKDSLVDRGFLNVITESECLEELRAAESYFARNGGFVGLKHFVKTHLGEKGFDYRASYEIVKRLERQWLIEVYPVENPDGVYPTSAIRTTDVAEEESSQI